MASRHLGATDGEIVGVVVAALSVISALGIVVAERPRGATLVWVGDQGARIITRSAVRDVPWGDLQYVVGLYRDGHAVIGRKGSTHRVDVDDRRVVRTMRGAINAAVMAQVQRAAATGAPVDFGAVTLAGRTVTFGSRPVDAASLGAVETLRRWRRADLLRVLDRSGRTVAKVRPDKLLNSDVLFQVLHREFGVVVPWR